MILSIFIVACGFLQDTIPLKPNEEFEVRLDYQFKPRPASGAHTIYPGNQQVTRSASTDVLPYLVLEIKMLAVPVGKARVAISNNMDSRSAYKRVAINSMLQLDLGFTDDMIDRVKPHEYTVTFLDDEKEPVNRIVISIGEDGSFFVNGEKRGMF